jgi:hypothetical protein
VIIIAYACRVAIADCVIVVQHCIIVIVFYRVEVGLGCFLKNVMIFFAVKLATVSQCELITWDWKNM